MRITIGATRIEEARKRKGDSEKVRKAEILGLKFLKEYEEVCRQEQRQGKVTDAKQAF